MKQIIKNKQGKVVIINQTNREKLDKETTTDVSTDVNINNKKGRE